MVAITGIGDFSLWASIAQLAGAVYLYASRKAERDPLADLTFRLRHPLRWRVEHPWQAVKRFFL